MSRHAASASVMFPFCSSAKAVSRSLDAVFADCPLQFKEIMASNIAETNLTRTIGVMNFSICIVTCSEGSLQHADGTPGCSEKQRAQQGEPAVPKVIQVRGQNLN